MGTDKWSARCTGLFVLVCAVAAARAVSAVDDGPLLNGNFESPPNRNQMTGSVVTGANAIPYWTISGHIEYIESGQKQGDMILPVPEGSHAVRLGNEASIQQQINVTQGNYYSITFSASRTCAQDERLTLTVVPGSQTSEVPIQTIYTSCGWDYYSWAFKANSGLLSLTIHNPGQEEDPACGPIIDAIAIKTIRRPDPTQNNLLRNGDFEEGPYIPPDSQSGVLVPPKDEDHLSPLPGWKIMAHKKVVKYIDSAHFAVPQGARAVELVSGGESALMQEVDTAQGSWYKLAFSVGSAGDGCAAYEGPMKVQATAGQSGTKDVEVGSQGWQRAELVFQAAESSTKVVFVSLGYHTKSDNSGTLCGPVVDDVSLVAVSQPSARRLLL